MVWAVEWAVTRALDLAGDAPEARFDAVLGLERIDRFVSMSDMKHDALVQQGVEIVERVAIPDELVPADAHVEIAAKKAAGYDTRQPPAAQELTQSVGRPLEKY